VARGRWEVWRALGGEPREGRSPSSHAVVVERDGSWGFLTLASASGIEHAPTSVAELERRRERRERDLGRRQAEAKTNLELRRQSARTVTLRDVDSGTRSVPATLPGMVERLEALGGVVRVTKGRLDVRLPPGEFGGDGFGNRRAGVLIARALYLAEDGLVEAVKRNGEVDASKVPDRALLPSGALAP
jgi:hypothetical protein